MKLIMTNQSNATLPKFNQPAHLDTNPPSFALTPARRHRQFLPEPTEHSIESLKGYDHTKEHADHSYTAKLSAVKQRGGGSWLLGFARLRSEDHDDELAAAVVSSSLPELVRSTSSSSLDSSSSDDVSTASKKKGVTFNESVVSHSIPHSSVYTPAQRRRMYSSSLDVRQNKIRNKKEYRYDGYDWRNCTEEWEMSVCMVTGELVHPVHSI